MFLGKVERRQGLIGPNICSVLLGIPLAYPQDQRPCSAQLKSVSVVPSRAMPKLGVFLQHCSAPPQSFHSTVKGEGQDHDVAKTSGGDLIQLRVDS